jgi:hypothetical protein
MDRPGKCGKGKHLRHDSNKRQVLYGWSANYEFSPCNEDDNDQRKRTESHPSKSLLIRVKEAARHLNEEKGKSPNSCQD